MPSPTLRTSPTSLTSASAPKLSISRLRIAESSEGWIFISMSSHGAAQTLEFVPQRRIDHARADFHDEAAKQRGIDLCRQTCFAAELRFEHGFQFIRLRLAERPRGRDFGIDFAPLVAELFFES